MPAEASNAIDLKLLNMKLVVACGNRYSSYHYQELEVYAKFVVTHFVTNKESIVVKGDTLDVALSLPKEVTDKIKEKDEEAKRYQKLTRQNHQFP